MTSGHCFPLLLLPTSTYYYLVLADFTESAKMVKPSVCSLVRGLRAGPTNDVYRAPIHAVVSSPSCRTRILSAVLLRLYCPCSPPLKSLLIGTLYSGLSVPLTSTSPAIVKLIVCPSCAPICAALMNCNPLLVAPLSSTLCGIFILSFTSVYSDNTCVFNTSLHMSKWLVICFPSQCSDTSMSTVPHFRHV